MEVQLSIVFLKIWEELQNLQDRVYNSAVFWHTSPFHLQISTGDTFYPTERSWHHGPVLAHIKPRNGLG